jgi:electron transfer flavoprotein alpha subunit
MTILLVAEQTANTLSHTTLSSVTAASQIGGELHLLVAGQGVAAVAQEAAKIQGVAKVLLADGAEYAHDLAENLAVLVAGIGKGYSHILAPASTFGKDFTPRVAALLDVAQVSDIIKVVDSATFVRPIYAGNVLATVKATDAIKVVTVRPSAFARAGQGGAVPIETIGGKGDAGLTRYISQEQAKSDRPELTSARVMISGGRGMGGPENFKLLEKVADKLGAALGASRVAVDSGWVPNDWQVGQTGKVVAPDLYIAVGISGAIQHLAGMKESKVIVAINKDENAPIFEVADYGLVGDLFQILPALEAALG